jgi:endonuclease/exonuclease/phosphatase (EEP) superfamily protein YafD
VLVLTVVLWLVVIVLAGVAALRTWGSRSFAPGAWIAAATPVAFLLVWPTLVLASIEKNWPLVIASATLVGCQALWLSARRRDLRRPAPQADGDGAVTIFCANLCFENHDVGSVAEEIADRRPDVVVLLELTSEHLATLDRAEVLDPYRWRLALPAPSGALGIGMWSRVALEDLEAWTLEGIPQLRGRLRLGPGRSLGILAVHAPAPWPWPGRR